jgi:Flp pilus assembly protein TadG
VAAIQRPAARRISRQDILNNQLQRFVKFANFFNILLMLGVYSSTHRSETLTVLGLHMRGFTSFLPQDRGNVMLSFVLGSATLAAMVGGGVEIVRVNDAKASVQAATDAAALAAASLPDTATTAQRTAVAEKIFAANLASSSEFIPGTLVATPNYSVPTQVSVQGRAHLETVIGVNIFGAYHTVEANATAIKRVTPGTTPPVCPSQPQPTTAPAQVTPAPPPPPPAPPPPAAQGCVWALGTGTNPNGFLFNSGNTISAPLCQLHGHGTGSASVMWNHGNTVTFDKLLTKGGITANGPWQSWFQANAGAAVANDPHSSGLPQPSSSIPCTYTNFTANGAVTLNPGVYCGNTNLNANGAVVRMNPGLYVIRNADFNVNGGQVNATGGVTIYHEGDHRFALNGGSSLNIEAPTSGTYAGLAIYEKYGLSNNDKYYPIDANGGIRIQGIIYLPTRHLTFNSGSSLQSNSVKIIGKTVNFSGTNWTMTPYTAAGLSPPPPSPPPSPPPLPVSVGTGYIVNGSFETPAISAGTWTLWSWNQYPAMQGWTSTRTFEIHNAAFWSGGGGYGTDGVQYAEIEKDLSQTITLPADRTFELSWDYRQGDNGSLHDNKFEVIWDNQLFATIDPQAAGTSPTWMRMSMPLRGTGQPKTLTIRQLPGADNNHGAFMDRFRLVENVTLSPPPPGCPGGAALGPPPPPSPLRLKS